MQLFPDWRAAAVTLISMLVLAGCETTGGYQQAYNYCDNQVGECYRNCEAYEGSSDYGACQASCETEASACFGRAFNAYQSLSVGYSVGYLSPWYGSYYSWYPDRGFIPRYGRYGGSHYGSGSGGYYPGRRYRPDGRYDPRYDGYRGRRPDQPRGDRPDRDRPRGDRPDRDRPRGDNPPRNGSDNQRPLNDRPVRIRPRDERPVEGTGRRPPRGDNPGRRPPSATPPANRPPAATPPANRPPAASPPAARPPAANPPARPPAANPPPPPPKPASKPPAQDRPVRGSRPTGEKPPLREPR